MVYTHKVPTGHRQASGIMIRAEIAVYISLALMVPFLAWGFYLVRLRFVRDEDVSVGVEAGTLAMLIVFYAFQFALLEALLADSLLQFVGACLILITAGVGLYGAMITSLISRALVGVFLPDAEAPVRTPHLGAGERMERLDDFEGALHEYESVAKLFPGHPDVVLRIGSTLARLGRFEEAARQLETGLAQNADPEESYPLLARLVEILVTNLDRREDAIGALGQFAAKYDGTDESERATRRMERLQHAPGPLAPRAVLQPAGESGNEDSDMPGALLPGLVEPPGERNLDLDEDEDTELPGTSLPPPRV